MYTSARRLLPSVDDVLDGDGGSVEEVELREDGSVVLAHGGGLNGDTETNGVDGDGASGGDDGTVAGEDRGESEEGHADARANDAVGDEATGFRVDGLDDSADAAAEDASLVGVRVVEEVGVFGAHHATHGPEEGGGAEQMGVGVDEFPVARDGGIARAGSGVGLTAMRSATRPEAAVFCAEVASWPRPEAAASAMRRFFRGSAAPSDAPGEEDVAVASTAEVDAASASTAESTASSAATERTTSARPRGADARTRRAGARGRVRDAAHAADIVVATLRGMRTALV